MTQPVIWVVTIWDVNIQSNSDGTVVGYSGIWRLLQSGKFPVCLVQDSWSQEGIFFTIFVLNSDKRRCDLYCGLFGNFEDV